MVERLMEGGERLRLWSGGGGGGGGLCSVRCDDDSVMGTVKPFYPFCLYLSYWVSICAFSCLISMRFSVCVSLFVFLCVYVPVHLTALLSIDMFVGSKDAYMK